MTKYSKRGFLLIALGAAVIIAGQADAFAGEHRRYRDHGDRHQFVVAESWHGHGTVRGPVRQGRHGLQVRMPGGTWIDCGVSCTHTLRTQTVDFWENQGQSSDGVGYFRIERSY